MRRTNTAWLPRSRHLTVVAAAFLGAAALLVIPGKPEAATLPSGFQESIVFSGLTNPTAIRFASDGRVFVAEKSGVIKVFDGLTDTTPDVFANLNVNVYNFWDRGLLGFALDPNFPASPYVYVMYAYDAAIGGTAPRWGTPGVFWTPARARPARPPTGAWSRAGSPGSPRRGTR